MLPIIYHLSSICVVAQQNAWPGNRFVKCADAYIIRRKCYAWWLRWIIVSTKWLEVLPWSWDLAEVEIFLRALYTSLCVKEISCVKNRLGCRNLRRHSQLQTWWTQIFFFFRSFHFFSSRPLALPCGKPVGLSPCASKGTIYHLGLSRPVLNKTHDREIALRNARMRIYFDANLWDMPFSSRLSEGFGIEPLLTVIDTLEGPAVVPLARNVPAPFLFWAK